jgi:putative heme iron utilization protein
MSATPAAIARAITIGARTASLATLARDPAGYPYASLVAVAWDVDARPLLLLSRLAEHTKNLAERSEASLLVLENTPSDADPLAHGRVTILGKCEPTPATEIASARATFLAAHPEASTYVDFADFAFYRLEPASLRYVGGFGRMTWIDGAAYRSAR